MLTVLWAGHQQGRKRRRRRMPEEKKALEVVEASEAEVGLLAAAKELIDKCWWIDLKVKKIGVCVKVTVHY